MLASPFHLDWFYVEHKANQNLAWLWCGCFTLLQFEFNRSHLQIFYYQTTIYRFNVLSTWGWSLDIEVVTCYLDPPDTCRNIHSVEFLKRAIRWCVTSCLYSVFWNEPRSGCITSYTVQSHFLKQLESDAQSYRKTTHQVVYPIMCPSFNGSPLLAASMMRWMAMAGT